MSLLTAGCAGGDRGQELVRAPENARFDAGSDRAEALFVGVGPELLPPVIAPATRTVAAMPAPGGALLGPGDGVAWVRISADGTSTPAPEVSFPAGMTVVASDGKGFLATLVSHPANAGTTYSQMVDAVRLSASGIPVGNPIRVGGMPYPTAQAQIRNPSGVYKDGAYFLLWGEWTLNRYIACGFCYKDGQGIAGARLTDDDAVVAFPRLPLTEQQGVLVPTKAGATLLWSSAEWEHRPADAGANTNRWKPTSWQMAAIPASGPITLTSQPVPPLPVQPNPWPTESNSHYNDLPHLVASDGDKTLVLWSGPSVGQLWAELHGTDLSPLGEPFAVPARLGQVVFTGATYLLVWTEDGDDGIVGTRVAPSGSVIDEGPFAIAPGNGKLLSAVVPLGGDRALVAYRSLATDGRDEGNARVVLAGPGTPTSLVYAGDTSQAVHHAVSVRATLTSAAAPVAGQPLAFELGALGCVATTDAQGLATCSFVLAQDAAGQSQLRVVFPGTQALGANRVTLPFEMRRQAASLRYTGDAMVRPGGNAHLSAVLTDDLGVPRAADVVSFCWVEAYACCEATTDTGGSAACDTTVPVGVVGTAHVRAMSAAQDGLDFATTVATVIVGDVTEEVADGAAADARADAPPGENDAAVDGELGGRGGTATGGQGGSDVGGGGAGASSGGGGAGASSAGGGGAPQLGEAGQGGSAGASNLGEAGAGGQAGALNVVDAGASGSAGGRDASSNDAGIANDGASALEDANTGDAAASPGEGCSCDAAGSAPTFSTSLWVAFLLALSRRRRNRIPPLPTLRRYAASPRASRR